MQRHFQTLLEDNAQWQTLIDDDVILEIPYAPAIGHPARLPGREEVVRHVTWFVGAVEDFRFYDLTVHAFTRSGSGGRRSQGRGAYQTYGTIYLQDYVLFLRAAAATCVACANISILCVQLKRWTRRFLVLNSDDKLARDRSAMKPFEWPPPGTSPIEEKRPLRRQHGDHHFLSLVVLAVTTDAFLMVTWVATKALFFFLQEAPDPLKTDWQRLRPCFERLS